MNTLYRNYTKTDRLKEQYPLSFYQYLLSIDILIFLIGSVDSVNKTDGKKFYALKSININKFGC